MEYEEINYEEVKRNREIAKEILIGKWGPGQNRRQQLIDAGYDADAVNQEVIRLLNKFK
ncbi:MAG: hypothetical protein ABWY25_12385 [Paenisporosarcina sp.]